MPSVDSKLEPILSLYEQGQFLKAHVAARELGPLEQWPGTEGRLLAGRLSNVLGGARKGSALHLKAWRTDPDNVRAILYGAHALLERRSRWKAWQVLSSARVTEEVEASDHAALHGLRARVLSLFRDFDGAERALSRAEEIDAHNSWNQIERSFSLMHQDRYREALAASRRALEIRPWAGAAVMSAAHLLQLLERDEESVDLLAEALDHIEAGPVAGQLAALQLELGRYSDTLLTLELYEDLSPLLDRHGSQWLHSVRTDAAYRADDLKLALRAAERLGDPFHRKIAERLRNGAPPRRRVLPVRFVRQRHMTCGPATLAMLGRFFGEPTDHLSVADEICYGGTTHYSQRRWAEQNGFVAREFTLNVDDARSLIDRGVPFGVSTVQSTSAHMQAIMGYDARLGTFVVRDPYLRNSGVALDEEFVEHYRSSGPRALVIVPESRAELLEGLQLADRELYDFLFDLQTHLLAHDRDAAYVVYRRLRDQDADHSVTIHARQALSAYEADPVGVLSCIERLLERHPGDDRLRLEKLSCLQELGRRHERLDLLEDWVARPGADPVFAQMLARELAADARQEARATRLLQRTLRKAPGSPISYSTLADVLWGSKEFDRALELYRFAACLEDTDERLASAYFSASAARGRAEEALALLRDRFGRFAKQSGHPAMGLFMALDQLERTTEGFEVLDDALRARPEDGDLLLFAADAHGRYGNVARAEELLQKARGLVKETARLAVAARLASFRGRLEEALGCWRDVLRQDPMREEAHGNVAFNLEQTVGKHAALEHLEDAAHTFPFRKGLQKLYAQALADHDPQRAEAVLRGLLERDPADGWCRRELALRLMQQGDLDEALAEARAACDLEPNNPQSHGVRGHLLGRMGRLPEAKEHLLKAISQAVDYTAAISELFKLSRSEEEWRQALHFVRGQLAEQASSGDGVMMWWHFARQQQRDDDLLQSLTELGDRQPGLWQVRSATAQQLLAMGRLDEAHAAALQATEGFPLVPRLWLDLAEVCNARSDDAGEVAALERALAINPAFGEAVRQLSRHHRSRADLERAKSLLEHAVARDPLDAENHAVLAEVLAELGEDEAAARHLQRAIRLEPGFEWAWQSLKESGERTGRPELIGELARELARHRPGNATVWFNVGRFLQKPEELEERLAALEKACKLNPAMVQAHDLRAELLAECGRFDDAVSICNRLLTMGLGLPELAGRVAWIRARRGDVEGAVADMRRILSDHPHYSWGWFNLLNWLSETDSPDYLSTAEEFVRRNPDDPHAYRNLAVTRESLGMRKQAMESLRRAVELDPSFAAALADLFWMQLEDGATEEAARTLEELDRHVEGVLPGVCRAGLACARRDPEAAADQAAAVLCRPDAEPWALHRIVSGLREAGMGKRIPVLLEEALKAPGAHPLLGGLLVEQLLKKSDTRACRGAIEALEDRPAARIEAAREFLAGLAQRNRTEALLRFIDSQKPWLRSEPDLWGVTIHALMVAGRLEAAAGWAMAWRGREDLPAWALVNATLALRCVGRWEEAAEVSARAVTLPPDDTRSQHVLWHGFDLFLDDRTDESRKVLQGCRRGELSVDQQFLFDVLHASLEAFEGHRSQRAAAFRRARKGFTRALLRVPAGERRYIPTRTAYRKCVRKVARRRGSLGAWLWAVRKSFQ